MIRRDADKDWLLISQVDHAAMVAQLAEQFGNSGFDKASDSLIQAIRLHDAGWPLHDDAPTLNDHGFPLDVFETPRSISLPVWAASADRAMEANPYSGLLVSLHSLSLSIHSTSNMATRPDKVELKTLQDQFEVNKFQHREVERQEQLRKQLNFNTALHLKHGLADVHASERDDQLRFDFRLLQVMDLISLCLCSTNLPAERSDEVLRTPTGGTVRLSFVRDNEGRLRISPWPFGIPRVELNIACRRIGRKRYGSMDELRHAYNEAARDSLTLVVTKR